MKKILMLIAIPILLTGCGKEIPGDIIQPDKMEKVLYDYHLAISMSTSLKNTDKEAYRKYVFRKHHITEADFDSSMVWYTREAQELTMIYANLEKKFRREYNHAEALLKSRGEESLRTTMYGDTVDIWNQESLLWLTKAPLMNKVSFEFKTDTNFHPRDSFLWNLDFHFFRQGEAIMGLNVVYENDSVTGETRKVVQSGKQAISLYTDSAYSIKALNGFIYIPENQEQNPNLLVHGISLMRYHKEGSDTLAPAMPAQPSSLPLPKDDRTMERLERPKSR